MGKIGSGIRTKTYYCGNDAIGKVPYLESDLFAWTQPERKTIRRRRHKVTCPKQKDLNNRRAARYFALLLKTNFHECDLHVTLTYNKKYLPDTVEAAEHEVKNFLRRVSRMRKKKNLPALKYIYVTEQSSTGRIHHHIVMNAGLDRDTIEQLWQKGRGAAAEHMGHINADRLRLDEDGLDALAAYLSKDPKGRKRWCPSRNLAKPEVSTSDTRTSKRQFHKLTELPEDSNAAREYFEKEYPGYQLTHFDKYYNDVTGSYLLRAKLMLRSKT